MSPKTRFIFAFLLMSNTLLMVFLTNIVLGVKDDITNLQYELATKTDLANLQKASADEVLIKNCTSCHAENRFANFHGSEQEMLELIEQMQLLAGTSFDPGDVEKVHASLSLLKCSQCHLGGGEIKRLALRTEEEQKGIIREMLLKAEESVERQEIDATQEAYHEIYGF